MPQENKPPLFSIIVPVYNVETYLPQCVDSVLAQSFQDFELILVDDGSTDSSGKICNQYDRQCPSIKTIHQRNQGLSAARNSGIAVASGEYLVLLDGDDYLEPYALQAIQENLEPKLDLLRYQAQEIFDDKEKVRYEETGFETISGVEAFKILARYHYTENAWLYAYRREFFTKNHFQYATGCVAEDFGLTPLIIARAKTVKAIPDICYDYRQREGSIMHDAVKLARRTADIEKQLSNILPKIAEIPGSESVLHYLVVSFLTEATRQGKTDFLKFYQESKDSGMLKYIHPTSLRAAPRSILLRYFPQLFYLAYR